ncbi:MAG: hypothetical protein WAL29_12705 [Bacteroidales bacterium]
MKFRYFVLLIVLLLITLFSSCRRDHYKVKTSDIKVDIVINRLEKDLFTTDPEEIPEKIPGLKERYNGFLQLFSFVINTGDINASSFGDFLVRFCTDRQNHDAYELTMKLFPDVDDIEKGLEDAFRHYLYYFPGKNVPEVYTCITGFNTSIITGDSVLGIGLERYLGADCKYYRQLEIYNYLSARMTPLYILPDCLYGWGASEWDFGMLNYPEDNVLAEVIHEGKLKYFEKCMLPETPDNILFGFTPDQMKFCLNNEARMWLYLVENDLVFSTDKFIIRKLVGEAPFTSYFTNESPGRAAGWIGFRIVESYMMKNQGASLSNLMENTDIQDILEKAKYNPK